MNELFDAISLALMFATVFIGIALACMAAEDRPMGHWGYTFLLLGSLSCFFMVMGSA